VHPIYTQLSIRKLLIIIGLIAVLLAVLVGARRHFRPTPSEWAWDRLESTEQYTRQHPRSIDNKPAGLSEKHMRDFDQRRLTRDRRLARAYSQEGTDWSEGNQWEPYTERLANGELVSSMLDFSVPLTEDGGPSDVEGATAISTKTVFTVVNDPGWKVDNDSLSAARSIEVQVMDGPHAGKHIKIDRAFLRRVRR
jgi:hypothetical protein